MNACELTASITTIANWLACQVNQDELELLGVFSGERLRHVYPNGDQASIVDIVFVCRKYHGELRCQPEEVLRLGFFPLDQLPEPVCPTCMPAFEKMMQMR